uniref:Pre-mRNA processing factor 4 (PRP4)-like domain-containing protein n=1 Tax=Brassica oleracea var. oleracea TaxID=109376 RepID=A0A0D3CM67_BRAOL
MVRHPPLARPPAFRPPQNGGAKADDERYVISEESRQARERQERAMQELLRKCRAAAMAVPTNNKSSVRGRLRRLGDAITLFGEREMERRARLAQLMARLDIGGQLDRLLRAYEEKVEDEEVQYLFFTEGPKELREARIDIAKYSIKRAAVRVQRAKRRRDDQIDYKARVIT